MKSESWVLLVEDDALFALLFRRAWQRLCPNIELVVVGSLADMRRRLEEAAVGPRMLIVDRTLPDGDGHQAGRDFPGLRVCWSATPTAEGWSKPQGKEELEVALRRLATEAGLDPSPPAL